MRNILIGSVLLALLFAGVSDAAPRKGPSGRAVKAAIDNGAAWLKKRYEKDFPEDTWHSPIELTMLTLAHAQFDRKDPMFKAGMKELEQVELRYTYRVAVLAMVLNHLNALKYRRRIAHCAQWLVDTQLPGGEWGYPGMVAGRDEDQTTARKVVPPEIPEDADPRKPFKITRRAPAEGAAGQAKGDFSNTQYAVLGLRACRDAKLQIPKETWQGALDYMKKYQHENGGWGYVRQGEQDESPYASLTCAGVCGAAICLHALGKKRPHGHPMVAKGLGWLKKEWIPTDNAWFDRSSVIQPHSGWQYYNLYSLERVGSVLGLKKLGKRDWYSEGAQWVIDNQRPGGSWVDPLAGPDRPRYMETADTCFAILFLCRATPALTGS